MERARALRGTESRDVRHTFRRVAQVQVGVNWPAPAFASAP
jgi:hypothetical protein